MANFDAPFGLTPIQYAWGGAYDGRTRPYLALSGYATALFIGDPVVITGTSNTVETRGFAPGTLPVINKATAGATNAITGVIVGFLPLSGFESTTYGAASTTRIALVADSPDLLFAVQDDASASLVSTVVGSNANLVFTHSGSIYTGRSGVEILASTATNDATFQTTIISLLDRPDNEIGNWGKWLVRINVHTYNQARAGFAI